MRILLTGHKGFIGSHVYEHLTRIGYDVDGLDRPDDIGDFADVGCADYDIVIHLAAYAARCMTTLYILSVLKSPISSGLSSPSTS